MRKRFPLCWTEAKGFHVDLPSYTMIAGTHAPLIKNVCHADGICPGVDPADVIAAGVSILVDLPESVPLTSAGQVDAPKLRKHYPSHCPHGDAGWKPPKVLGDR